MHLFIEVTGDFTGLSIVEYGFVKFAFRFGNHHSRDAIACYVNRGAHHIQQLNPSTDWSAVLSS